MMHAERSVVIGNWLFVRRGWLPIAIFFVATAALFFTKPDQISTTSPCLTIVSLTISFLGLIIRALTVGYTPRNTSGRNTSEGQKADVLNTTGIYSIVRNPLYIGNFLMWLGIMIFISIDWVIVGVSLLFWIYYEKIVLAEEDYLYKKFGTTYAEWCSKVMAFIPTFGRYVRPNATFSMRNVIKREYHGFFYMILSFVVVDLCRNIALTGEWRINEFWLWAGVGSIVLAAVVRYLSKRTSVLDVDGR